MIHNENMIITKIVITNLHEKIPKNVTFALQKNLDDEKNPKKDIFEISSLHHFESPTASRLTRFFNFLEIHKSGLPVWCQHLDDEYKYFH